MSKLRFSLSNLMAAVLAIALVCAAVRWLGIIWLVALALAGLCIGSVAAAIRWAPSWRTLSPSWWHVVIWSALSSAAAGMTVRACLGYNEIAGTDLTPDHISRISAAVLGGPLVGPVANPGAGESPAAWRWTAILFAIWLAAASPFLVRRTVHVAVALACWTGFLAANVLWYFGAMISLGFFLS